jgi:hypothetical protein
MNASTLYRQIEIGLNEAVPKSVEATLRKYPKLTGFALCTDSNVSTLFSVATDFSPTEARWATPNEWKTPTVHRAQLRTFSELLAKAARRSADPDGHAKVAWKILEDSLRRARVQSSELLLLVADTDPDPQTTKEMRGSAKRLNSPSVFDSWLAALETKDHTQIEYLRSLGIKI